MKITSKNKTGNLIILLIFLCAFAHSAFAATSYSITPNPATVSEGAGTLTFTITRSGTLPAETIYASTTTSEGYANSGDYTGILNQSVTFTSSQTTRTVSVNITDDTTVENNETFGFIVQRNSTDPATTYLAKSTFTITDNDSLPTSYSITPNPATVDEGAGTHTFTITRSGGLPAETIYASTTTSEGYANSGDYTGILNQSVSFTSGQTTRTVSVGITDDTTVENNETFGFIVQRNTSDPITTFLAKSTFTITDNDVQPTTYAITPNPATVDEGAGTLTFTITRSGGLPAETIYASTTTSEGYANSGDYTGVLNQSVSFTSGQATRTVSVGITDDTTVENNETFGFIVQRSTSDPITTYLAKSTFTITDNDVQPTTYAITPNPAPVDEGAGTLAFTITRSGGLPAETIYASTTTSEGYANSGDYTGILNQSVSFTSGQATRTVSVSITDDTSVENNETFGFIVQRNTSDPITTYLAKSTFTITDNDVQPTTYAITPNPATVDEGAGTLAFTITRSGGLPAETIYASTTTSEGYANSGDYTGILNQSVSFTSGQATRTVSVNITDDTSVENNETFGFIVQRNTSDPITTYLAKSTFTITDNDGSPSTTYAITPNPATVSEGAGTLTFTITRSGTLPVETVYASTTTSEGFANSGDYTGILNQSVSFTSGQTTRTVSVTIVDDASAENNETFGFIVQRNSTDPISTYLAKSTFTITDNDGGGSGTQPLGVDVSAHQGAINWSQVATTGGKTFAMIRASAGKNTTDSQFAQNVSDARSAGLLVGAYHFAYPEYFTAHEEAQKFLSVAQSSVGTGFLPPTLDIEDSDIVAEDSHPYRLGKAVLSQWIRDWCSEVEAATGVKPMIYATRYYANNYFDSDLNQHGYWVPTYPADPSGNPINLTPWTTWTFQQYRTDPQTQGTDPSSTTEPFVAGTCPGITGYADLDSFNGDLVGLQALAGNATATVATPTITPNGGSFNASVQVSLTCGTSGATIRYTTDGSNPTSVSPVYVAPFTLTASATIKSKAVKAGYTDSAIANATFTVTAPPTVAIPTITPSSGNFSPSVQVTLACTTSGATIRYTTDGSNPTTGSPAYLVPFTLTSSATVKAKAFKNGYNDSDVATANLTVTPPQTVATPTITPSGGSFIGSVQVSLACTTSGATIRYTTDGNDPTGTSPIYASPFTLNNSVTVKAKAFANGYNDSAIAASNFTITPPPAATPTITPPGGSFNVSVQVTLACATSGATIRYTTDGNDPTGASPIYSSPFTLNNSAVVKAKAFASGYTDSDVGNASFSIASISTVATPTITPSGGSFNGSAQINLACATSGATIRYTTDGNDPTGTSQTYTGPFALNSSGVVKAKAFANGYTESAVASATFTVLPFAITGIGGGGALPPNGGVFQLEVHSSQAQVTIQSSDDLVHWIDVGTLDTSTGKAYFVDGSAGANTKRFYRLKP